jgi:saccharopine dehydrogenase-like NADP-dependent oxidoreductase
MVNWTLGTKRSETTTAVFDIIGDGPEPQVPVDTALEHIGALTDALRIISPIACRNITGLEVNYTSDSNSVSQVAPASIPVDGCVGSSILVLGSGMVVGPALDVMVDSGANVTLASNDLPAAEALVAEQTSKPNLATDQSLEVVLLDMQTGTSLLSSLIASHDVVVSLLPASMHVQVASLCLDNRTHFVSASYESPSMRELDLRAKEIGVTLLNEIGLDPGIDHMSAMQIIDEAHAKGEVIESFTSLCGGLPSPQASDNPLGYKFSWNPAGVLQASQNPAHFIFRNQEKKIPGDQLMLQCRPVQIGSSALSLEQLPNRDSLMYRELYGLPCAHTVYRGTIRYTGFAPIIHSLLRCGMFSDRVIKEVIPHTTDEKPVTWADLMDAVVKPVPNRGLQKTLQERLELDFFGDNSKQLAETSVKAFEYLGD